MISVINMFVHVHHKQKLLEPCFHEAQILLIVSQADDVLVLNAF